METVELNGKRYEVKVSGVKNDGTMIHSVRNITGWKTPYLKVGSKDYRAVLKAAGVPQ